ncbi:hypothetical protein [Paraburkholderia xenovorans]
MMDIASISAAVSSTKAAFELAKLAISARDDVKLAEAKQLLNERIVDIQMAALQLQEKMSSMRDEIEALKNEKREVSAKVAHLQQRLDQRAQYALEEIHNGAFALAYIEPDDGGDPAHYVCQPCMDNAAKKVVLQRQQKSGRVNLVCHECNAAYFTGETYSMNVSAYR